MQVMRNFRKIMERTRESYGLPASGPGANELPRVLRAPRVEHKARQGQSKGDAGVHSAAQGCTKSCGCAGGCGRKAERVNRGEVVQVPDLQQADAQTSRDSAQGVIGPVCAAKVAPRLPLVRAKKTAQTTGKRPRRGVLNDQHTADLFGVTA